MLLKRQGFMRIKTQGDIDDDDLDRIDVVTASANSRLGNPISDAEQDEVIQRLREGIEEARSGEGVR